MQQRGITHIITAAAAEGMVHWYSTIQYSVHTYTAHVSRLKFYITCMFYYGTEDLNPGGCDL